MKDRAVLAGDRLEVVAEAHRRALVCTAIHPHGALGAARRVVHPADQVPGQRSAISARPDAGAPAPLGLPGVVADRVVDDRERVNLRRRRAAERERSLRAHARLLARPHLLAPVRAQRFDAWFFLEAQLERHARVVHANAPLGKVHAAAPAQRVRALAQLGCHAWHAAQMKRPEALMRRADLHLRRAGHQLLAEDAHVAPALQRPAAAQQARPKRRRAARVTRTGRYAESC